MLKISKYKLKDGISQVVFRDGSRNIISITKDNISDELVKIAIANGKENCFVELSDVKKNLNQSGYQSQPATSTLTEVPTESNDLPEVPNKRQEAVSTEAKKRGRPAKSKE